MTSPDYDDPAVEEQWCNERRAEVAAYLQHESINHGRIGEWPAWHVAPYVSIWAIESATQPEWVGWWVIGGDLPMDYVSADAIKNPRDAMQAFALRWMEVSSYIERGKKHPTINMGTPESWPQLAPLLKSRAQLLAKWVKDDEIWED